jgi:hypothetical protein
MSPPVSRQEAKYHLSLAGEFYVAAELQRRGIAATVTYGNAKKADVLAFSGGNIAVAIEVKSTPSSRWVVGGAVPPPSPAPWVFVHVPPEATKPPAFFVLTQAELFEILHPLDLAYRRNYLAKHKEEYGDRRGVVNLSAKQAEPFRDHWTTIVDRLRKVGSAG